MSLHYIIDGYNLMKQIRQITGKRLKCGREGFIRFLETEKPQGSPRNKLTIVFDGKQDVFSPKIDSEIEIIFSRGQSADERIKKMVESLNKNNLVVVTDDNELKYITKIRGVKVISGAEFLKKSKRAGKTTDEEKLSIDSRQAREITRELEGYWLRKATF